MTDRFIRTIVPEQLVEDFKRLTNEFSIETSEPIAADSTSEPLNAPMAGVDAVTILQLFTALITGGTALLEFSTKLIEVLKQRDQEITITDKNGDKELLVNKSSDPATVAEHIQNVSSPAG